MTKCDWCQEEMEISTVVINRDPTTSQEFDYICSDCAVLELSEHSDELLADLSDVDVSFESWEALVEQEFSMTALPDEWCA